MGDGGPTTAYDPAVFGYLESLMFKANTAIEEALTDLETRVEAQMADWIGDSRQAYYDHKAGWDAAVAEMNNILINNGVPTVNSIGELYGSNESHMQRSWAGA